MDVAAAARLLDYADSIREKAKPSNPQSSYYDICSYSPPKTECPKYRREYNLRILLSQNDITTVSEEDIRIAEAFAFSIGIKPWWRAREKTMAAGA